MGRLKDMMVLDLAKISRLSRIPAVTLFEDPMLTYLRKYSSLPGYRKLNGGRYLVFEPQRFMNGILLCVHLDRLGLVLDESGRVTYSNYYGYKVANRKFKPLTMFGERFLGKRVYAYRKTTGKILGEGTVRDCAIQDHGYLAFDIDDLAVDRLPRPTPIAYRDQISANGDLLVGQIDNVLSIYVALELMKHSRGYTVFFSTEEEIGMSWKQIAEYLASNEHRNIIVVDTTSVADLVDLNDVDVAFRISDDKAEFSGDFVQRLVTLAEECKLRYYLKTKSPKGSKAKTITELGRLIAAGKHDIQGGTVQFPSVNYHTSCETTSIRSVQSVLLLLNRLAESMEQSPRERSYRDNNRVES